MSFIVIAPPKNPKSAGSMVLYELAEEIRRAGFSAERVLLAQNKDGHFFISIDEKKYMPLYTDTLGHFFDPKCSVVIHGENLHHKFFDKFNVARYYLNKIGALRNIGVPRQGEYKIGWSTSYIDDPDFLLRRPIIKKPISEQLQLDQPRLFDLTYVGKAHLYDKQFSRLPGTIELTRTWPSDVDEYLFLLSKTRFLFTFDTQTSVVEEAIVYGAMPVHMTQKPFKSLVEWKKNAAVELSDCCLSIDEFKKLNNDNLNEYVKHFHKKRIEFIAHLDRQKGDYQARLIDLLISLQLRFDIQMDKPIKQTAYYHQMDQRTDLSSGRLTT